MTMSASVLPGGILARLPGPPCKVVIMAETRLGAFICATPAFRALKTALPSSEIVVLCSSSLRELACRSPHLDRFVPVPSLGLAGHDVDARLLTAFFQELQEERFDLAIQMHGYGLRSSPFFVLLGAKINAGFVGPADMPGIMDEPFPIPHEGRLVDRFLALSTFLGAPAQGFETEYPLEPADGLVADALLNGVPRPLIGMHPGARSVHRQWSAERFAEVATLLVQRYGGTVVLLGAGSEHPGAEFIAGTLGQRCLNLAGKTSLPVLGAVLKQLAALVTNDTGPAHVAYALRVPTVTIFAALGRTPFWPPEGGPFRPLICQPLDREHPEQFSLDSITVAQVCSAAEEVMRSG